MGPGPDDGADLRRDVGVEREQLRQHRPRALDGQTQPVVARPRLGQDDVDDLHPGTGVGDALDKVGQGLARPGPGPDLAQAALVDIDDDDPALGRGRRREPPVQVGAAVLQRGHRSWPQQAGQRRRQRSQRQREHPQRPGMAMPETHALAPAPRKGRHRRPGPVRHPTRQGPVPHSVRPLNSESAVPVANR